MFTLSEQDRDFHFPHLLYFIFDAGFCCVAAAGFQSIIPLPGPPTAGLPDALSLCPIFFKQAREHTGLLDLLLLLYLLLLLLP